MILPSSPAECMHIGDVAMRFLSSVFRIVSGSNSLLAYMNGP